MKVPDYDEIVGRQLASDSDRRAASLRVASESNPDQVGQARTLARQIGAPAPVVERNPELAKLRARIGEIESTTVEAPVLRQRFSDPEFAKVALDDAPALSTLERALRPITTSVRSIGRFVGDIPSAVYGVGETVTKNIAPVFDPLAGTIFPDNPVRRMAIGLEQMRKQSTRGGDIIQGELPADAGLFERNLYGASRSFGASLPGLAATIATRNPSYALGSAGVMEFGSASTQALDKGATPLQALAVGSTNAGAEVFFERFGVNKLLKDISVGSGFGKMLLGQIVREVPSEMATSAVQQFNEQAILNPEKSIGDFITEMGPIQRDTVIQTIMQTVMTAGLGRGIVFMQSRLEQAQNAEPMAAGLAGMAEVAAASKLAGRDVDTFESFVRTAAEDGPVTDIYIDAQTLMQSGIADQVSEASPAVAEQLAAAVQSGGTVRIPVEEFAARLAPAGLADPLLEHLKTDPNGFSKAEAAEFVAEQGTLLQAAVEREMAAVQGDQAFRDSQEAVRTAVLDQLNTAGRFPTRVNEFNATLIAARTAVRAAALGMTPEAFFRKQLLRVQAQGTRGEQVLDQQDPAALAEADAMLEAQNLDNVDGAYEYMSDDRSHGDEFMAEAAKLLYPGENSGFDVRQWSARVLALRNQMNADTGGDPSELDVEQYRNRIRLENFQADLSNPNVLNQRAKAGPDSPGVGLAEGNKLGFWPALRVKLTAKLKLPEKALILTGTKNSNAARQISEIDGILKKFPKATDSAAEWTKMMAYALGSDEVPVPPYAFIRDLNGTGSLDKLRTLTQGQIDDASHGFENAAEFRRAYTAGELGVETTGKLFMWSFLSRGVSPYTQESLFIDAFNGADRWIKLAAEGKFSKEMFPEYEAWAKSVAPKGSGQPGAGATHNLNAFGQDFLFKMSLVGEDGKTHMQRLHDMMADPTQTGKQIRREFATFGEGVGIDNKVVSFTLLVAGFPDVMVLDRVQIRQLWDDGRFNGVNLYDGVSEPKMVTGKDGVAKLKPVKLPGSSLNDLAEGARGILVYEAIERGLEAKILQMYTELGRPQDASIGRYHWETWVADSQQEASHGTLGAILADAKGDDLAIANVAAKQGEYGAYEYGALYNRDPDGVPWFGYETPTGGSFSFSVPAFRAFLEDIKKPSTGVVPTKFKVTESGNGPWYTRSEVNQARLEERARYWADRAGGSGEGQRALEEAVRKQDADRAGSGADEGVLEQSTRRRPSANTLLRKYGQQVTDLVDAERRWNDGERVFAYPDQDARPVEVTSLEMLENYAADQLMALPKEALNQDPKAPRGNFAPNTNIITLLKNADLSTFLHEAGHYFFENDLALAYDLLAQPGLQPGEQQIVDDVSALLTWHGFTGTPREQLEAWKMLDFEEKRAYHERTAESFERYLFEGKAPSIELQRPFQQFRAWLVNVYRSIKKFLVTHPEAGTLNDDVRAVFDRMLATTEQIQIAEQARSMMPLFDSPDQAGMTVEAFVAYQRLGIDATNEAVEDLQARGLRDMQWMHNARGRVLAKLKRQSNELRRGIRSEVRTEVMSEPVYRAWSFLTNKIETQDKLTDPQAPTVMVGDVNVATDSLFTAIAKMGGLRKDEVIATWGSDPADKPQSGVFGKPVWRTEGGLSLDAMAAAMAEAGYIPMDGNGQYDITALEEAFGNEMRGEPQYSAFADAMNVQPPRPGEGYNVEALGAGRIDTDSMAEIVPVEIQERIKKLRMTRKTGGIHPDVVAEMFGFTSGDHLLRELAEAQTPTERIEALTDARMLEENGELASPEAIEREADRAIHNDVRARMVSAELNALDAAMNPRQDAGTDKKGRRRTVAILPAAAKGFAASMIARLKIRDIRPGQYAAAEQRASAASEKAVKAGDTQRAALEKRNQLINLYATRAAYDAQDEVKVGSAYLRKFDGKVKGVDAGYLEQIEAMLERFNLRQVSNKAIDRKNSLQAWLATQEEQGLAPEIPDDLRNEANRKNYREMTVEEFRGLLDTIKQLEHMGRLKSKLLTAKDQREYEAIRDEIVASIRDNAGDRQADTRTPTTNTGRAVASLKRFWASHIKAATWGRIFDGGRDGGPFWTYFVQPANERGDMETRMRAEATQALSDILAPVFKEGRMGGKGQFFPSIGRSLNREARIALALNTGNESNLQRLLGGEGWQMEQILPVLDALTAAEWNAVQAVWDHFESYRPLIGAKERRVYGREPKWIDAGSPAMEYLAGKGLTLRGGYYPVKFDPAASQRAEEHADAEGAKRELQGAYTSATTRRSFTKTRAEEVNGRPLLYTLSGLYSGVNDVIHDLAWHEWLIDVNRLLRSKSLDTEIRTRYGPQVKEQLKTWTNDIAEGDRGADGAGEAILARLRQTVSASGMGFNVMSAIQQPIGMTQSIVRVGAGWVAKGVARYIASPVSTTREVNEASAFMRDRARTRFRELNELRNRVQDESATMRFVRAGTFFLMTRVQMMVDTPTWIGAREKALASGAIDEQAVALADQAVIDAQGSGMLKDLSKIERGGPGLKLFTVFYSYMNTALNLATAQTMTAEKTMAGRAKLAVDYAMIVTVPAVLTMVLKDALMPGEDDDEDFDWAEFTKRALAENVNFVFGMFVIAREVAAAAKLATGLEDQSYGYPGPAGIRTLADLEKLGEQVGQAEFDDAFRKAAINVLGDLTGLPSAQINKTITGVNALADGETDNPLAVVFGFKREQ